MKSAIYALTADGSKMALQIAALWPADVYIKHAQPQTDQSYQLIEQPIKCLLADHFTQYDCLIFIMATGIVVRTVAPLLVSKTTDPAVLVVDEKGQFVISLLSGHLGGANQYANYLAERIGAQPVITTSTDLNQTLAFDLVAKSNDLVIDNIAALKYISQAMIHQQKVDLFSTVQIEGTLPNNIKIVASPEALNESSCSVMITAEQSRPQKQLRLLHLIPRNLVIGIGCRRGVSRQQIEETLDSALMERRLDKRAIVRISSVDIKSDEVGLIQLSEKYQWPLDIITRSRIAEVENLFEGSAFVKQTLGVAAVAEPCAYISSQRGKKIIGKYKKSGVTIAIYQQDISIFL